MDDYVQIARKVAHMKPDIIEINISCPNVEDELGKPMACSIAKSVRSHVWLKAALAEEGAGNIPVIVKLSPNVEDIVSIASSVLDAGADGITAINTGGGQVWPLILKPLSLFWRIVLVGSSGPAIKPLAVKYVHDIYKAHQCLL